MRRAARSKASPVFMSRGFPLPVVQAVELLTLLGYSNLCDYDIRCDGVHQFGAIIDPASVVGNAND